MKLITYIPLIVAAAALLFLVVTTLAAMLRRRPKGEILLSNIAEGTHPTGNVPRKADAAITTRYLLAKAGSDDTHVNICGAVDTPIGVITDEAAAAEDEVNVALLGGCPGTKLMVASGAITSGALLEPAASGKVQTLGAGAGTHHVVGRAMNAATSSGDLVEVQSFYFLRVI